LVREKQNGARSRGRRFDLMILRSVRTLRLTASVERTSARHTDAALKISFFHFPLLTRLAGSDPVATASKPTPRRQGRAADNFVLAISVCLNSDLTACVGLRSRGGACRWGLSL